MSDFAKFVIASAIGGIIAGISYDLFKMYWNNRPQIADDRIEASEQHV